MPIRKVKGGYKWGGHGKVYKNRKGAEKQAAAAHANGYVSKSLVDRIGGFIKKAQIKKNDIISPEAAQNYEDDSEDPMEAAQQ